MEMKTFAYQEKLTTSKQLAVLEVSQKLGINPSWLMLAMYFETAGSLSPAKRNFIGSTGLIQFTRDSAGDNFKWVGGKKYTFDALALMSFEDQLRGPVYEYFKPYAGKMKTFNDVYLTIFFPLAVGKPENFVLQTSHLSASLIAKQNTVFDRDKNSSITKSEITDYFKSRYSDVWHFIIQETPFKPDQDYKIAFAYLIVPALLFFCTIYTLTLYT